MPGPRSVQEVRAITLKGGEKGDSSLQTVIQLLKEYLTTAQNISNIGASAICEARLLFVVFLMHRISI